jgi:hypothetical protein
MDWLTVGGIWFWIITVLFVVFLVWEVATERAIASFLTILAYLGLIHVCGNASIFAAVRTHPEYVYIGIPAFFLAGAAWALAKWWFFVWRGTRDPEGPCQVPEAFLGGGLLHPVLL